MERPPLAAAYGDAGRHHLAFGFHDAAAACLENAARLDATSAMWPYLTAVAHQDSGRLEAAAAALDRALNRDPTLVFARLRRGRIALERAHADRAVDHFEAVIAASSGTAAAHHGLGLAALDAGRPAAAIGHLERALRSAPEATAIHHALAAAHRQLGEEVRAADHRRRAGSRLPVVDDPWVAGLGGLITGTNVHLAQGIRARQAGNRQRAKDHFRRAFELDQRNAQAAHNLGAMLAEDGEFTAAVPLLERAVTLAPDVVDSRFDLASALAAAGRLEASLAVFEDLLARAPEDAEAKRRRDLVRRALDSKVADDGR